MTPPARVPDDPPSGLGWLSIVRLGLVQASLGAIVVMTTSTLNRVMVVELALPAVIPGALVTVHHVLQLLRPRMGYGSDVGGRHTPWIVGGMGTLAAGGAAAAGATALMGTHLALGLALGVAAFSMIGCGVSACGTSLLVLMAKHVSDTRRASAATVVWTMMIAGFAVTATLAGKALDPYSPARLVTVSTGVSVVAFVVSLLAIFGVETKALARRSTRDTRREEAAPPGFFTSLAQVWAEPNARRFTAFVFVSMLAYSAQDLILEPLSGNIFAFTPGQSTRLSGAQHAGVFTGMVVVALVTAAFKGTWIASLKGWVAGGCLASAICMMGLVLAAMDPSRTWPLTPNVFALGISNGALSMAAIGAMMMLAGQGMRSREGVRMGVWGAAQAVAMGAGGLAGTGLVDAAKLVVNQSGVAYAIVFAFEVVGFLVAHRLAMGTVFGADVVSRETAAGGTQDVVFGHGTLERRTSAQ